MPAVVLHLVGGAAERLQVRVAGAAVVLEAGDVVEVGAMGGQAAVVAGARGCSHVDEPLETARDEPFPRIDGDHGVVHGISDHPGPAPGVLDDPPGDVRVDGPEAGELGGLVGRAGGGLGGDHDEHRRVDGLACGTRREPIRSIG